MHITVMWFYFFSSDVAYTLRSDVYKTDEFLLARGRFKTEGDRLVSRVHNVTSLKRGQKWQERFIVVFDVRIT